MTNSSMVGSFSVPNVFFMKNHSIDIIHCFGKRKDIHTFIPCISVRIVWALVAFCTSLVFTLD